jgi:carboxypeptidase Taq
MQNSLSRLKEIGKEIKLLEHAMALLGWDQETYMPPKAVEERSEQLSLLQTILHRKATTTEIGDLLGELGVSEDNPEGDASLGTLDRAYVRVCFRDYTKNTKLPTELVSKLARQTSIAQSVWAEAREKSDFSRFAPHLEELLVLIKEKAECLGYEDHPYDALLDEFEPGMLTRRVKEIFDRVREELAPVIEQIASQPNVDDSILYRTYPLTLQRQFGEVVLEDMGYSMERGRLDVSAHPFTTSLGRDDVRLTTRYSEDYFNTGIFGTIHEGGHGLYELGFAEEIKENILADATSLGIHESQSRIWENIIGRSYSFWSHYFPLLQHYFPETLADVSLDQFYRAINKVEPSFIRVEADEVTYNMHIILRFELELALITGELAVDELPGAWRSLSEQLLGIRPEKDSEGVLQDIHWSMGGVGYFPTYALGNLYSAQFYSAIREQLDDYEEIISSGDLQKVLFWLREKIHRHGRVYTAEKLCEQVTGEPLDPGYFVRYIKDKYSGIYDV